MKSFSTGVGGHGPPLGVGAGGASDHEERPGAGSARGVSSPTSTAGALSVSPARVARVSGAFHPHPGVRMTSGLGLMRS